MLAVTDGRIPAECRESLLERRFEVISMPPFPVLPLPVASHPDMLMFLIGERLITHKDYYTIAKKEIDLICEKGNLNLLLSDEHIGNIYPSDILFNAALVGKYIFGLRESVSRHILKIADAKGIEFINVRQGYSRCSIVSVDDWAIITSDTGIAAAAYEREIDVLLIRSGHVRLDGYASGFIGGSSGRCDCKIYFCGNIDLHPDGAAIKNFCFSHGCEAVSLGKDVLFDAGTIFFI